MQIVSIQITTWFWFNDRSNFKKKTHTTPIAPCTCLDWNTTIDRIFTEQDVKVFHYLIAIGSTVSHKRKTNLKDINSMKYSNVFVVKTLNQSEMKFYIYRIRLIAVPGPGSNYTIQARIAPGELRSRVCLPSRGHERCGRSPLGVHHTCIRSDCIGCRWK
jgi:hypothetical protein